MTDKTTDAENESALDQDDAMATESWQSDLPPEDDFHDQGEDLSDDLMDETVLDTAIPRAEEEAPRRGKGVLVGALLFGAAVIGGLAYLQFGGGDGEKTAAVPVAKVLSVKEIKNAPKVDVKEGAVQDKALEVTGKVDMTTLYHQAQQQAANAVALPNANGEVKATEKPSTVESGIVSTVAPTVVAPMPPPPALPVPALDRPAPKTEVPVVQKEEIKALVPVTTSKSEPSVVSPDVEARLKTMTQQIDDLKAALDRSLKENEQLTVRLEETQKAAQAVAEKEKEAVKAEKAKTESEVLALPPPELPAATVEAEKKKEAAKPVVKKVVAKTSAKKKVAKTKPTATPMVLRAATPDAAWVAESKDSQQLRRVAVGETLPGLGKVKEIRQVGDQWELVGEKGTVR